MRRVEICGPVSHGVRKVHQVIERETFSSLETLSRFVSPLLIAITRDIGSLSATEVTSLRCRRLGFPDGCGLVRESATMLVSSSFLGSRRSSEYHE